MYEFKMPSLGAEMEAGTLVEWKVKPGDQVKRGDIIAVVDTDKAAVDVEVWQSGTIDRLQVDPGKRVPVGTVLALLRTPEEAPQASAPTPPVTAPRFRASPAARKRAEELHVDLATVQGTGPDNTISLADVEAKGAPPPSADLSLTAEKRRSAMRATIAAAMARSKREIPHYYLSTDIDMHSALERLAAQNAKRPVTERVLYSVLLLKAAALALKTVPELNGFWKDGVFQPSRAIHIGVAISLKDAGLVAPALHDVDKKSTATLMRELQDLVMRARKGTLRSSEFSDPTITVTNLGENSAASVLGVIYPPQVALLGFGEIEKKPWVVDDQVVARPVITATLSADHRTSDGHRGAVFLSTLRRLLQNPQDHGEIL